MYECIKDVPGRAEAGHTQVAEGSELLRLYPHHFQRCASGERVLTGENGHSWTLQEELDYRRARIAELDAADHLMAAEEAQRNRRGQSDAAFWRESAAFLSELEARDSAEVLEQWDPEMERIKEEAARHRFDHESERDFWDRSAALVTRLKIETAFPARLRDATEEFATRDDR